MKVGIMQPYFFPYIGYFQLMNAVDVFVVYDIIEYSKGGWINRNRILVNGKDSYITLPIKNDSDFLDVRDRYLASCWDIDRKKMANKIKEAYRKAPFFDEVFPIVESCLQFDEKNLFKFVFHSIKTIKEFLEIETPFVVASEIDINHKLTSEDKVIRICNVLEADLYLNPIGGVQLYKKENFTRSGIELQFLKTSNVNYKQFSNDFIHSLSIIDVLMFNSKKMVQEMINRDFVIHKAE